MNGRPTAAAAGKIDVGGDLTVNRLGFGAMRITGPGIWGDPPNRDRAKEALRRAVALDVNFIDTADSYGPEVSERLIAEALYPYPEALVIATKRQVALAWLLSRSPQVLPIPGSGDPEHVEQNIAAATIELTAEEIRAITLAALSR
jgi:pyridoxine 4-dehydrogenase